MHSSCTQEHYESICEMFYCCTCKYLYMHSSCTQEHHKSYLWNVLRHTEEHECFWNLDVKCTVYRLCMVTIWYRVVLQVLIIVQVLVHNKFYTMKQLCWYNYSLKTNLMSHILVNKFNVLVVVLAPKSKYKSKHVKFYLLHTILIWLALSLSSYTST